MLLFVGRIQPLKAPDLLIRALGHRTDRPDLPVRAVVCGGPSGSGLDRPTALEDLARDLGVLDKVTFLTPTTREHLADLFRAADLTVVPSYSESFGLVAVESQACGTPVVAANVGGLRTAVADQVSGVLVEGHNPDDYARVMARLADDRIRLRELSQARWPTPARSGGNTPPRVFSTRTGRPGSTSQGLISPQPTDPMTDRHSGRAHLEKFLHAHELDFEEINETTVAVVVPGEKKLTTTASFAFGDTTVTVNAFVIRHPDENDLAVYRWLLERNRRMYGLAYSIDHHGDIYLTGRFPLDAITDAELDRIFGSISEYADGAFNSLLELVSSRPYAGSGSGEPRPASPRTTSQPSPTWPTRTSQVSQTRTLTHPAGRGGAGVLGPSGRIAP